MVDSSRSLIQIYEESEWRTTRLEVIQALSRWPDSRSLHFLIGLVLRNEDLAEQNLAIRSLGLTRSRGAQLFLSQFYSKCDATLKGSVALALGQCGVQSATPTLVDDLERAMSAKDGLWAKNLVLALGELKAHTVIPTLYRMIDESTDADFKMAVLFSLGRLERDLNRFKKLEALSFTDSLIAQVFQASLSQIQIRAQLKLEDYLEKIFESEAPHPALPLELLVFSEKEVKEGLALFHSKEHLPRLIFVLKGLSPALQKEVTSWLTSFSLTRDEWLLVFQEAVKNGVSLDASIESIVADLKTDLELRLAWIESHLEKVNFEAEAKALVSAKEESIAIQFLNLWNEWGFAQPQGVLSQHLKSFLSLSLSTNTYGRLIRAASELRVKDAQIEKEWAKRFETPELRASLLLYAEIFHFAGALEAILKLSAADQALLARRILEYLESLAATTVPEKIKKEIESLTTPYLSSSNPELMTAALRVVRVLPLTGFEAFTMKLLKHSDLRVQTGAAIALKAFPGSREASEALSLLLEAKDEVLRTRVLDTLCAHTTLLAKRAVIDHLRAHLDEELTVDKIYRCFDPEKKGGDEFFNAIHEILKSVPDHPQWEKLVYLRDRLKVKLPEAASSGELPESIKVIDERLLKAIPQFASLDPETKLALRAAEDPFLRDEGEGKMPIDKAPTVLEFCKALDLILDRSLGQKHLFPKLDRELHDFQTTWHRVGFGQDYPQNDLVLTKLGLKGKLSPELFPLHKAKTICGSFFNGKIIQDRFKIFDGLRAWAVIFLVFARKVPGSERALLNLPKASDEKCISVAKRLMQLQDLRNPAAHRQTYLEIASVQNVRKEAIEVMNTILEMVN